MNWDTFEGNWNQFKGAVREKWGDLTDDVCSHGRSCGCIDVIHNE